MNCLWHLFQTFKVLLNSGFIFLSGWWYPLSCSSFSPALPSKSGLFCRFNDGANYSAPRWVMKTHQSAAPALTTVEPHLLCSLWGWHFPIDSSSPGMTFLPFIAVRRGSCFLSLLMIMSWGTESKALLNPNINSRASSPWSTGLVTPSEEIRLFWQDRVGTMLSYYSALCFLEDVCSQMLDHNFLLKNVHFISLQAHSVLPGVCSVYHFALALTGSCNNRLKVNMD